MMGKFRCTTGHESQMREEINSSTLSLTSALSVDGWSTPRPGRFTPGKVQVPTYCTCGDEQLLSCYEAGL